MYMEKERYWAQTKDGLEYYRDRWNLMNMTSSDRVEHCQLDVTACTRPDIGFKYLQDSGYFCIYKSFLCVFNLFIYSPTSLNLEMEETLCKLRFYGCLCNPGYVT